MNFSRITLLLLALVFVFPSCKKDEKNPGLSDENRQFNDDSNTFKSESDQADNDINTTLQGIPAFGRIAGVATTALCGVTVDSSLIAQKIIFLNFDSTMACLTPARSRSGQIMVQLTFGNYWRDPGSQITVTYMQYRVKRLSDGKSITLNGVKTITNINGNNWLGLLAGTDTLRYRSRAFNVQATFNSGLTATWNVAHVTEWTYRPALQQVVFTAKADTMLAGYANMASWGTNRFQKDFRTQYNAPVVANSDCGYSEPVSGDITHRVDNSRFDLLLGLDQNGNVVTSGCPYGFQVAWYYNNNSVGTAIYPY